MLKVVPHVMHDVFTSNLRVDEARLGVPSDDWRGWGLLRIEWVCCSLALGAMADSISILHAHKRGIHNNRKCRTGRKSQVVGHAASLDSTIHWLVVSVSRFKHVRQ